MSMSIPYETTGRTHQKARTRAALVAATRELLAEGITPTVEEAAGRAQISRTTAYRYLSPATPS
jgi:AcrR family transcriptional regulator